MKKFISIVLIAIIAISGYRFVIEHINTNSDFLLSSGTDEEKIKDTISKYEKYYNEGDFENLVNCCTGRYKSDLKSQMGIGSSILSGLLKKFTSGAFGDNSLLQNIWSAGTALCMMELKVEEISYYSDEKAEVELTYTEAEKNRDTKAYIEMQKDGECWYVASDFYQYSKK